MCPDPAPVKLNDQSFFAATQQYHLLFLLCVSVPVRRIWPAVTFACRTVPTYRWRQCFSPSCPGRTFTISTRLLVTWTLRPSHGVASWSVRSLLRPVSDFTFCTVSLGTQPACRVSLPLRGCCRRAGGLVARGREVEATVFGERGAACSSSVLPATY